MHRKWNKLSGKPPKVGCEQYGMMTDAFFITQYQQSVNYRFPIIELGGKMKKEDRIRRLIPAFEGGRFYLPKKLSYTSVSGEVLDLVGAFVNEELSIFPVGRHDDMLDALARITDPDLHATFPKIEMIYLGAGETLRDSWSDGFDPQDMRTW
jgi:hypothetical protein